MDARVQFHETAAGHTRVTVDEYVTFNLPITFITAKIVQVMARREASRDMENFLWAADQAIGAMLGTEAVP